MGLDLIYNDGQTPLDEDEKEGLIIQSIAQEANWMNLNNRILKMLYSGV